MRGGSRIPFWPVRTSSTESASIGHTFCFRPQQDYPWVRLSTMNFAAVSRNLLTFGHPIVSDHTCHTQTIVRKNFHPSFGLRNTMLICGAPCLYSCFVPKK